MSLDAVVMAYATHAQHQEPLRVLFEDREEPRDLAQGCGQIRVPVPHVVIAASERSADAEANGLALPAVFWQRRQLESVGVRRAQALEDRSSLVRAAVIDEQETH